LQGDPGGRLFYLRCLRGADGGGQPDRCCGLEDDVAGTGVKAARFSHVVAQSVARALQLLISVVYLKPSSSQYRAVGHPIGNAVGEHLVPGSASIGRRALDEADADAAVSALSRNRTWAAHSSA